MKLHQRNIHLDLETNLCTGVNKKMELVYSGMAKAQAMKQFGLIYSGGSPLG